MTKEEARKARHAEYMRWWRKEGNPESAKRSTRKWRESNRDYMRDHREKFRDHRKKYRENSQTKLQKRAWNDLYYAIKRGTVRRLPCEVGGDTAHGHHADYSKPLEVRWLCNLHHRGEHSILNKSEKP